MATCQNLGPRLLQNVEHRAGCDSDFVAAECSDLTWNQVFLELDRFNRTGEVVLTQNSRRHYRMALSTYRSQRVMQVHKPFFRRKRLCPH